MHLDIRYVVCKTSQVTWEGFHKTAKQELKIAKYLLSSFMKQDPG